MKAKLGNEARLGIRVPAQARAHATLDRIVAATQRLLRVHHFEEITIAEIVAEADTNTGSFYARFKSKEALLPYLYEAYNSDVAAATAELGTDNSLRAQTLRAAVTLLMGLLRGGLVRMDGLVRAMTLYARSHPDRLPESAHTRSHWFFDKISELFKPHLQGANPGKRARIAAFAAATLLREHRLFPDAPLAKALAITHDEFAMEVEKMVAAYLETPGGTAKGKLGRDHGARGFTP